MSKIRKGMAQAASNEESFNMIVLEVLLCSVGVGFYFDSIAWGAGTFVALSVTLFVPYVRIVLYTIMSITWGSIAVIIVDLFTDSLLPPGQTALDLGIIGLLERLLSSPDHWIPFVIVAVGVFWGHREAHEHVRDIASDDERSL